MRRGYLSYTVKVMDSIRPYVNDGHGVQYRDDILGCLVVGGTCHLPAGWIRFLATQIARHSHLHTIVVTHLLHEGCEAKRGSWVVQF